LKRRGAITVSWGTLDNISVGEKKKERAHTEKKRSLRQNLRIR
jgi:hypothetical protein